MKLAFLIAAALPLAACNFANGMTGDLVQPSGSGGTRTFDAADFTAVSLRGSDDVEIRTGNDFSIRAEGDSALLDRLEVRKDGNTLRVGRKDGDWSWGGNKGAKFVITMPALASASVAGSGDMTIDRVEGDFDGSIAGSGNLNLGEMRGGKASVSIAGSGNLGIAGGQASELKISIAGSGDVATTGLRAARGDISIAGSGNVRTQVTDTASLSIVGSGDVDLTGGAKCTISKMGSGDARCG